MLIENLKIYTLLLVQKNIKLYVFQFAINIVISHNVLMYTKLSECNSNVKLFVIEIYSQGFYRSEEFYNAM